MKLFTDRKLLSNPAFHNIVIKIPNIKPFTYTKLLRELPVCKSFLEEPSITQYSGAFTIYAHS